MRRAHRGLAADFVRRMVVGFALCILVVPANGQGELTEEKLLAWFEAERAKAVEPAPLGHLRIDYEAREHATINAATLVRWKREAEPHPEHPHRSRIPIEERRLRYGPDKRAGSIWLLRDDAWRISSEPVEPRPGVAIYGDRGQHGDQHWRLYEDSVVLETSESQSAKGIVSGMKTFVSMFLYGGLNKGATGRIENIDIRGDRWTIEAASERGWGWTYEGNWDSEVDRGFVRRLEERPSSGLSTRVWDFKEYRHESHLGTWIATAVDKTVSSKEQRALTEYVVVAIEPVPSDEMRAVLRVPAVGREDAIRGTVRGQEQDVAAGEIRQFNSDGRIVSREPILPVRTKATGSLQFLGVLAAITIVGILIWLRIRNNKT